MLILETVTFLAFACSVHSQWTLQRSAPTSASIRLHIGVKPDDAAHLSLAALNIADPHHDEYRKHLSAHQVQKLLAVEPSRLSHIKSWLRDADVPRAAVSQRGNIIEALMTIDQAETLLNASYHVYSDGTTEIIRTENYTLPHDIRGAIDFVSPTNTFPSITSDESLLTTTNGHQRTRRDSCGAGDNTTPSCIRQVYNISYTPKPNRTTFAIYATEASSFRPDDLQSFLQSYNKPAADAHAQYRIIGPGDPTNGIPGIGSAFETALDTQTGLGLAFPARAVLYDLGGVFGPHPGETYDPFVRFLQDLIHNETIPSVVSFSESNPENQFDPDYARSLCMMMMAVGARGTTLVFSSGNNGAQGGNRDRKAVFEPRFPASCPFVLSVGGTTNLAAETAATKQTIQGINKAGYTASGGGFSELFQRPGYQDIDVQSYVASQIPSSYFNKSGFCPHGRGIPDVSAFSTSFPTVFAGLTIPVGGTSAAAPTWAAIIAILNDYEASRGRPSLGFVNPWLYTLRSGALKDIVTGGDNAGACQFLSRCALMETLGYNVTRGWDPVTGLGSPVVSKLMDALDLQAKTRIWS